MNDPGHKCFWGGWPPMPWKEHEMIDGDTAERLEVIEGRLDELERIMMILLEWQEEKEDGEEGNNSEGG